MSNTLWNDIVQSAIRARNARIDAAVRAGYAEAWPTYERGMMRGALRAGQKGIFRRENYPHAIDAILRHWRAQA